MGDGLIPQDTSSKPSLVYILRSMWSVNTWAAFTQLGFGDLLCSHLNPTAHREKFNFNNYLLFLCRFRVDFEVTDKPSDSSSTIEMKKMNRAMADVIAFLDYQSIRAPQRESKGKMGIGEEGQCGGASLLSLQQWRKYPLFLSVEWIRA
ncbi:hypothetical protein Tco_0437959 [Tanacetum coccineum]